MFRPSPGAPGAQASGGPILGEIVVTVGKPWVRGCVPRSGPGTVEHKGCAPPVAPGACKKNRKNCAKRGFTPFYMVLLKFSCAKNAARRRRGLRKPGRPQHLRELAEVREEITKVKFPGRGQQKTLATDVRGAIEWAFLLPGRHAARIRRQATDLLVRYLGGDLGIIELPVCQHLPYAHDIAVNRMHSLTRPFANILPVS